MKRECIRRGRTLRSDGMSLVELLVGVAILGIIAAAFASLMSSVSRESRSMTDKVESADMERQLQALLSDDSLCGCQLASSGPMAPDSSSPTGATGTSMVELDKITASCADPSKIIAAKGQKMASLSSSFKVARIAVRDLQSTGRRDPSSNALDEYTGAIYVEFDNSITPGGRPVRPIKVSKIFTTTVDGSKLSSCSAATDFYQGPMVTNSAITGSLKGSIAPCPKGYSIRSGGWRSDGKAPTCPNATNPQSPVVIENRPMTAADGSQGWLVRMSCMTVQAVAICQRGHN